MAFTTSPGAAKSSRYLESTGDERLTILNYHDVLTHYATAAPGRAGRPMICRLGHRSVTASAAGRSFQRKPSDNCPFCENREILAGFNDLRATHPRVASELDPAKNNGITADEIFAGSHERYVWTCRKTGTDHDFPATVSNRTSNHSGCPVCLNRIIVPRINDVPTLFPALANDYDPAANPGIELATLAAGSNTVVSWKCEAGHTYQMSIGDRTRGGGCRLCPKGERALRTLAKVRPDLIPEFHPTQNAPRTPTDITVGSHVQLTWVCPRGHKYEQSADRRNAGYDCPFCSGQRFQRGINDVLALHADLCQEWHPYMNGTLRPHDRDARTRTIIWQCIAAGHVTKQTIALRVKSGGCTVCPPEFRVRQTSR